MSAEGRLSELGIVLPGLLPAVGNYLSAKQHGDLVYVSGHGPLELDRLPGPPGSRITLEGGMGALIVGKVGGEVSLEKAYEAARVVGLFMLSALRAELGSLDRVSSVVKVFGMVNCAAGFTNTAGVIDGCSDLLVEIFGEQAGRHARSAVGMAELPLNIPVEIEMIVAVSPS